MPRAKSGSTQHNKGSRSYEDNIKTARSLREGSSVSNDSSDSDSSSSSSSAIGENFTLEDMSDDGTDAGAGPLSALELQGLLRREDHKEVTLKLRPRTVDRYFSHILAGGKLSSKGKKALRDRYRLSETQFRKLAAPSLHDSKLHRVEKADSSGISKKLLSLHSKVRDVAKVLLKAAETLSVKRPDLGERDTGASNAHVDLLSNLGKILPAEQVRAASRNPTIKALHRQMFERSSRIAKITKPALEDLQVCGPLAKDAVQLLGQVDVHLTQCRELRYEYFLRKSFRSVLKAGRRRKKRFADNKIFRKDLDKIVRSESSSVKKISRVISLDQPRGSSRRDDQESDSSQSIGNEKSQDKSGKGHKRSSESSSSTETSVSSGEEHGHDDHDTQAVQDCHQGHSSDNSDDYGHDGSRDNNRWSRGVSRDRSGQGT